MKDKTAMALPAVKEVVIGDEVIKIEKLPLGEYSKLFLALKNLPGRILTDLQGLDTEDNEEMIPFVFSLFAEAWEQVIEILAIGSGIDKERLKNDPAIGLDGGLELFIAIWEVNNLNKVVGTLKNVMARA